MSMISRIRHFSTILSPNSSTPLTAAQKTKSALSLLKTETNPERILEICRAASLTPDSHMDRLAFSAAVSRLSSGNHFDAIRRFLEELKSRSDLRNERYLSQAMILYGQANMLDHAIRTFSQMEDELNVTRSVKSLNSLILASILAKDYKQVSQIYMEYPTRFSIQPNLNTYNLVIKAFSESGSSSSIYSVLEEMDRNSVKPDTGTLNNALAGFYREEKFEEVGELLNFMEKKYGICPTLGTYNVRIRSLCKLNRSSEAKALLEGMISRGRKPNLITYSCLIYGFCREGNLGEGKTLFSDMRKRGYVPDGYVYFTLVHFLCEGGEFEYALEVCRESMAKDWYPNFNSMKKLVNGLASISKVDDAKEIIKQLKEKFPANADKWDEVEAGLPQ